MFQEVERERDRERLESKRKLDGMKGAFEEEQEDTKKQITDLQVSKFIKKDHVSSKRSSMNGVTQCWTLYSTKV